MMPAMNMPATNPMMNQMGMPMMPMMNQMGMPMMPMMNQMGMPMMPMMNQMGMPMMPYMMPGMACRMTMEMTKEGMVCKLMPLDPSGMDMLKERCTTMASMMNMGMPMMMMLNGMPMMMCMSMTPPPMK